MSKSHQSGDFLRDQNKLHFEWENDKKDIFQKSPSGGFFASLENPKKSIMVVSGRDLERKTGLKTHHLVTFKNLTNEGMFRRKKKTNNNLIKICI